MSRVYRNKDTTNEDENQKVISLQDPHTSKLDAICSTYGWSARRAACFILAYTHNIETIQKTSRILFPQKNQGDVKPKNLFLPMTPLQANLANEIAKQAGYDFTSLFKQSLDQVYSDFKEGKLDFNKNELTKRFVDSQMK
ncbi:hypothetical protein [Burkholderia contaminans]|uniref:hypothetical protein n=1 Tax=Burkholderia contaminans TaxID=488447 RepID=UPI0015887E01|nr:hypothetical protein [Burkholderia contaminans]